jgi:hypothetical protein
MLSTFFIEKKLDSMSSTYLVSDYRISGQRISNKWSKNQADIFLFIIFSTYFYLKLHDKNFYYVNKPIFQLKTPLNQTKNTKSIREKNIS